MLRVFSILSILVLSLWAEPTLKVMKKEHRVAIVVGNSSYDDHELPSSTENARKMKKFLEKNGFYVYYGENLDKRNFVRLLRKFNKRLRPNDIGLLYYSGHSVQTKGKNYLVTLDNGILDESMIVRKSISLNSIYSSMEKSYNRLNIVILDTAFNAPFGSIFEPKKQGLAPIGSTKSQVTFMSNHPDIYSDSTSFTNDFITVATRKGLELTALKSKLTTLRKKGQQPQPYITIARNQPFYFILPDRIPTQDELAYSKIKNSSSKKELEKFINKYPKSSYTRKVEKQLRFVNKREEEARKKEIRKAFEAKAAEATRKARESEAQALREIEDVATNDAESTTSLQNSEETLSAEKNDIAFKLTKPEDVEEKVLVKPKQGEEHQTLLE